MNKNTLQYHLKEIDGRLSKIENDINAIFELLFYILQATNRKTLERVTKENIKKAIKKKG